MDHAALMSVMNRIAYDDYQQHDLIQASATIREQLKAEKIGDLKQRHVAELRKTAEITYPESKTARPAP